MNSNPNVYSIDRGRGRVALITALERAGNVIIHVPEPREGYSVRDGWYALSTLPEGRFILGVRGYAEAVRILPRVADLCNWDRYAPLARTVEMLRVLAAIRDIFAELDITQRTLAPAYMYVPNPRELP